jgi:hypothetical protein
MQAKAFRRKREVVIAQCHHMADVSPLKFLQWDDLSFVSWQR